MHHNRNSERELTKHRQLLIFYPIHREMWGFDSSTTKCHLVYMQEKLCFLSEAGGCLLVGVMTYIIVLPCTVSAVMLSHRGRVHSCPKDTVLLAQNNLKYRRAGKWDKQSSSISKHRLLKIHLCMCVCVCVSIEGGIWLLAWECHACVFTASNCWPWFGHFQWSGYGNLIIT